MEVSVAGRKVVGCERKKLCGRIRNQGKFNLREGPSLREHREGKDAPTYFWRGGGVEGGHAKKNLKPREGYLTPGKLLRRRTQREGKNTYQERGAMMF